MGKFKNNRLAPGCPPEDFEEETPESTQEGGEYLPLDFETSESQTMRDSELTNQPTSSVSSEVHDEVMGFLTCPTNKKPNMSPIRVGEKFMVASPNKSLNIPAGTVVEVSPEQYKSENMVIVLMNDDHGKTRHILIDRKILMEELIRLSSLEMN